MIPEQLTFTGEAVPVPSKPQSFAQIRRYMQHILEVDKPSRNDKRRAMWLYWRKYDGLDQAVGSVETLWQWWRYKATCPKTLDERLREVVREHPELGPSPVVQARRDRQSRRGTD